MSLIERLAYRGDFLLGTVLRFLPMVTTILLWRAVYQGTDRPDAKLAGYGYHEMIAYLLLVHIARMFSSMPGLAGGPTTVTACAGATMPKLKATALAKSAFFIA